MKWTEDHANPVQENTIRNEDPVDLVDIGVRRTLKLTEENEDPVKNSTVMNEDPVDLVDRGVRKTSRRRGGPLRRNGGPPKNRATIETPKKCSKKMKIKKNVAPKNCPSILSYFKPKNPKKMSEQVQKNKLENLSCLNHSFMMEKNEKKVNSERNVTSIRNFVFLTRLEDQKVEETNAEIIIPTQAESVGLDLGLVRQTYHQENLTIIKTKPN